MSVIRKIKDKLSSLAFFWSETDPEIAYDLWSTSYDLQPDNLMLALEEELFSGLSSEIEFGGKVVVDLGCGTGRHWESIYKLKPLRLLGFDVSSGMLSVLKLKFPEAEVQLLKGIHLPSVSDKSCDILVCTLALAHLKDIRGSMSEWNRILKDGGEILITDYHPEALSKGGNRTFAHEGKQVAVKNYIHPLKVIRELSAGFHFVETKFRQRKVDDSVRHYFEKQGALRVYDRFKGTPIVYGMILRKENVAS